MGGRFTRCICWRPRRSRSRRAIGTISRCWRRSSRRTLGARSTRAVVRSSRLETRRKDRPAETRWAQPSVLRAPIGDVRLAQIEGPLDAAASLVLQFAVAVEIVDRPSLGLDQRKLGLLAELDKPSVMSVAAAVGRDMIELIAVTGAERSKDLVREGQLGAELIEALDRRFYRLALRARLLKALHVTLSAASVRQSEPTDHGGQHQSLSHQRQQDDKECEKDDQIAVGKRVAALRRQRDGERGRQ